MADLLNELGAHENTHQQSLSSFCVAKQAHIKQCVDTIAVAVWDVALHRDGGSQHESRPVSCTLYCLLLVDLRDAIQECRLKWALERACAPFRSVSGIITPLFGADICSRTEMVHTSEEWKE